MTAVVSHPAGVFVPEYADSTRSADFEWWCRNFLVQSVDQFEGLPLVLEEWQLRFFSEALALGEDGNPFWRLVVLVVSRKNGKTAMLSAYSLYHLLEDTGSPEVLLAASSDKQAGRLFDQAVSFVRREEELSTRLHLREYIGEINRVDGQGKILRMASDPGRAHGYSPSLVVADEIHAWTTPSLRRAWGAFLSAGGARGFRQVFAITTAGDAHERENSILGMLVDMNETRGDLESEPGLTISRNHAARTLVYNYSAPTTDRHDVTALKLANPASWITSEYLSEQAESPALASSEVLQLHGCVWAAGVGAWIPADRWQALLEPDSVIPEGETVCVGVDVGLVHDTTAVVMAWKRPDDTVLVESTVFSADYNATADIYVDGGTIQLEAIEKHILALSQRYYVAEVAYDPRFFEGSAQRLAETLVCFPVHQSSAPMADAYQAFYASVMEGRLAHAGGKVLSAHVMSTAAEKTDRGWKIRKIRQSQRIDGCVAAVMAVYRAEQQMSGYLMVLD